MSQKTLFLITQLWNFKIKQILSDIPDSESVDFSRYIGENDCGVGRRMELAYKRIRLVTLILEVLRPCCRGAAVAWGTAL